MVERQWLYLPMYLISLKWIHLLRENIVSFRWMWTKESWFDSKSKENDDGWGEKVLATGQTITFTTKFWNKEWKNAHRKPERKKIESGEEKETEKQWPLVPLLCGWRLIIHIKLCHYAWGDDFFRIFFTRSLARALCSHAFRFSCAVSSSFHRQFYYDLFCIECVCVWRTGFATCISNCCRSFSGFSCFAFWS